MDITLKVIRDTVFKQRPIDSSQISNPQDKQEIDRGTELKVHSWLDLPNEKFHLRVAFVDTFFHGKNTWYVFGPHVELSTNGTQIYPPRVSTQLKNVRGCSTSVVRGLDRQILAEMNSLIPNILVNFEDLNVRLGSSVWPLLQPRAKAALARAIQQKGDFMTISSAYRTIAQQQILFNIWRSGRGPQCGISIAAIPGRSNHQSGLAIDVPFYSSWRRYLEANGWRWLGSRDPVHFDYVGGGVRNDLDFYAVRAFQRLWNRNNLNDRIADDGVYGAQTARRLNNSYVEGFATSVQQSRVLRFTSPFMQGEDVRRIQTALKNRGYSIAVDGIYGPGTFSAVQQFQRNNNLEVDGVVGPLTRTKLGI